MDQGAASPDTVVEGNAAFALALYDRLRSVPGNLFFSPFSTSAAMAAVYAGARGETAAQMARVMGFPQSPGELLDSGSLRMRATFPCVRPVPCGRTRRSRCIRSSWNW